MAKKIIKTTAILFFVLLFVGAIAAAGYFYYQYQYLQNNADAIRQKNAEEELKTVVAEVSGIMVLPEDETPTMATITDKSKLAEQPFFAKSENNDKVLFYTKAGKAILYRPSIKKVIDVTVIRASDATPAPSTQSQGTPAPQETRIAIYNGTTRAGLTTTYETRMATSYPNLTVATKAQAVTNYDYTTIVDLTGKNKTLVDQLAKTYTASISAALPAGEKKPEADILLVLGTNAK